ncbi:MAG: potassium channel protein, partial [Acidobacteria bacterium]|nr:potassium channel protein [Acidobacteriota bacterium]
ASERIADAAQEMTRIVEDAEEPHPVIAEAPAETDEIVAEARVSEDAPAAGRTIRALSIRTETGMDVLAIQRAGRWIYRPRADFSLQAGDRVLAVGPEDGAAELGGLCRDQGTEEED